MDPEILARIRRLHVALGRAAEFDLSKFPALIVKSGRGQFVHQDFTGGCSEAELSDILHGVIHNLASFHDHLQQWGDRNGVSRDSIHNFLKASFDFCVVRDLWNCDKHGDYRPGSSGWSKRAPRLHGARSVLELKTRSEKNSMVGVTMGKDGSPIKYGDGQSYVVVTGEVVDRYGNGLGDAHQFIERALRTCEAALRHFGM